MAVTMATLQSGLTMTLAISAIKVVQLSFLLYCNAKPYELKLMLSIHSLLFPFEMPT